MSGNELPRAVAEASQAVREATEGLIRAAEALVPEGMARAVDLRGAAVDRLRAELEAHAESVTDRQRRSLLEALALQAEEAAAALRAVQTAAQEELEALSRGSRALRGYAANSGAPSSLDRSG